MAAPVRIGICSFADDALVNHWYPPGTPPKARLPLYAESFSTVEIDSTFYGMPARSTVQGWADRVPDGFVVHVKAFGLMTRHPVQPNRLPPELREGLPLDARGRIDRPSPEQRATVFAAFVDALEPLRSQGKLGGILFQLPPYLDRKPAVFDYLVWAREQLAGLPVLVEFRNRSWFDERAFPEVLRFLEEHDLAYVSVDAPHLDAANVPRTIVAATSPLAYVRFHGRNALTWNTNRGSPAERFDYLYGRDELHEWVAPLRELSGEAEEVYAFFNNNNQTDGVAQAPAGAALLHELLEDDGIPVG